MYFTRAENTQKDYLIRQVPLQQVIRQVPLQQVIRQVAMRNQTRLLQANIQLIVPSS